MGEDEPKTIGDRGNSVPTREDTMTNGIDDIFKFLGQIEEILSIQMEPEKETIQPVSNKIEDKINALSCIKRKLRKIVNVVSKI